jgi:DNA polymerase-1
LPDEDCKIIAADYSGQEARVFCHYEGGPLLKLYQADPDADVHGWASDTMTEVLGFPVIRDFAKGITFLTIYGGGPKKIADMMDIDLMDARRVYMAFKSHIAPNMDEMQRDMNSRYRRSEPIRTLGGRLVKGEPPKTINGQMMKFDYKMINLLVQGSCADMSKQALIDYHFHPDRKGRVLLSMHDETVISVPTKHAKTESKLLQKIMVEAMPIDCPLTADAVVGSCYYDVKG